MHYWWVSQNSTFKQESNGGYLWSPKVNKNGAKSHYYDNMCRVQPGDIIFSFESGFISAIGIASSSAYSEIKPGEFGKAGDVWLDEGWKVDVDYHLLKNRIRPADNMGLLQPLLPSKYSPLQGSGRGNQAYLFSVPDPMAKALSSLIGQEFTDFILLDSKYAALEVQDKEIEKEIFDSRQLSPTEKLQLVKSRKGQGIFRAKVEVKELGCRVTQIKCRRHLIASHIKPWRASNNTERLDGNNGLLLAPHIDHLFDRGYISFNDNGTLLISSLLDPDILVAWSISERQYSPLSKEQSKYMAYHRHHVFLKR